MTVFVRICAVYMSNMLKDFFHYHILKRIYVCKPIDKFDYKTIIKRFTFILESIFSKTIF